MSVGLGECFFKNEDISELRKAWVYSDNKAEYIPRKAWCTCQDTDRIVPVYSEVEADSEGCCKLCGYYVNWNTVNPSIQKQSDAKKRGRPRLSKKVKCIDTGVVFDNAKQAADLYDVTDATIRNSAKLGTALKKNGLRFEYLEDS